VRFNASHGPDKHFSLWDYYCQQMFRAGERRDVDELNKLARIVQ
jgi:hypothetical protein